MDEKLLTVKEAAAFLQVSEDRLYRWVAWQTIPHIRLGRSIRFDPEALRKLGSVSPRRVATRKGET